MTLNHIECRNDQEVKEFLEKFKTGELAKIVDESEIK